MHTAKAAHKGGKGMFVLPTCPLTLESVLERLKHFMLDKASVKICGVTIGPDFFSS